MTREKQTMSPHTPSHPPHILIVDDEFANRLQVKFTLENAGYHTSEAAGGEEAMRVFQDQAPDLILLDVVMEGMNGMETCRTIRSLPGGKHIPIVIFTALENEQTISEAFEAGATDFISKPINLLVLGYRIRYWLRAGETVNQLQKSQVNLVKAQEIARMGHWEYIPEQRTFTFNSPAPELFGFTHCPDYTMLFHAIVEDDRTHVEEVLSRAFAQQTSFSVDYRITLDNGGEKEERILLNQGECLSEPGSDPIFVGIIQDITVLKQAEDKIRYLAYYDKLTGLANRSLFHEHWERIYPEAQRNGKKIAFYFIDLDHFKQINDTLGHAYGDKVLITVAERLKSIFRNSDVLARGKVAAPHSIISRVGGDEFTVIAVDINTPDNAAKVAERIIEVISKPLQLTKDQTIVLGASIGLSLFPEDGQSIDVLLKNADTAMSEAKQAGRNRYLFYQKDMNISVEKRFLLGNRLRQALENKELVLFYQPQYAHNGEIKGVEALIRWLSPDKGMIPPNDFLPLAEENGFIHVINTWVIQEACRQAKEWVTQGIFEGCRIAINISGNNVNFKNVQATIKETLQAMDLAAQHLEVELTERVMMDNTEEAVDVLLHLKEMGIDIAIDDFGTGYSALSHLQLFPLTTLKIDKSFIRNINDSEQSLSLLNSIIGIAKSLNLSVVAEGVETEMQRTTLADLGCDELQGFLLGRPVPCKEIELVLTSNKTKLKK